MNLSGILSADLVRTLGWTLLHSLWQGIFILLLAYLLVWIFRQRASVVRYNILCFALVFILLSSIVTFILLMPSGKEPVGYTEKDMIVLNAGPMSHQITQSGNEHTFLGSMFSKTDAFLENNKDHLVLFWFIGSMFFLARYFGGLVYISRLRRSGTREVDTRWESRVDHLTRKAGIRKPIRILESLQVNVPVTLGHLRPLILFPAGMLGSLPPEQVEAILMHEMAHILRRDYLVNTLQTLMEALFFYHPAVWLISGRIREERENICDDIAVRQSNDPLTYIKALTTMEELKSTAPVMATAFTGHKKRLLNRIKRMVTPEGREVRPAESLLSVLALVTLVILLGAGATLNTSRAESSSISSLPAINPDAVYSMSYPEAYHKALQEYHEAMKDVQGDLREYRYDINIEIDSLDSTHVYILSGPEDCESLTREYYYQIEMPEMPEEFDGTYSDMIIRECDDQDRRQIEKEYQRMEKDIQGRHKEFEKVIVTSPDMKMQVIPPIHPEWVERGKGPDRIIRQELMEDDLIQPGKDYIVEINASSMYINGEKQTRDVFKKYKKLYEGVIEDTIQGDHSVKLVF